MESMERKEVLGILLQELERLEKKKHVSELAQAEEWEKLKQIKQEHTKRYEIEQFLIKCGSLKLKVSELPEGFSYAMAMWANANDYADTLLFANQDEFAMHLADEAGEAGKNVAVIMKGLNLCNIPAEKFFSTECAKGYNRLFL